MTEVSIELQDLERRLASLEIQKKRLKLFLIILLMIFLTGGFSILKVSSSKVIMAERIDLVDKNGITRLKMELEDGSPQITFNYEKGDPCLRISMKELCFYDQQKKARVKINADNNLDSSSLSITDRKGENCVTLSAGPEGTYLGLSDDGEQKEVILSIDPIGTLNGIESSSGKKDRYGAEKITSIRKD
jgi:hypothetical protein